MSDIVLLVYNNPDLTLRCLESLARPGFRNALQLVCRRPVKELGHLLDY